MAKRILVVEDEPRVLEVIKKRLEVAGHHVITAVDGAEGFELAKSENPDLIVLDLMLPKKDGYDVCWELKHDPRYEPIPILMLTARTQDSEIERGMKSGADGYMIKPFDGKVLVDRVAELLQRVDEESTIEKGEKEDGYL
jgi:DNA-binding response OmpR family regulator